MVDPREKFLLLLSLLYVSLNNAYAQNLYFFGKIGSFPILMELHIGKNKVSGYYFYLKYKNIIPLIGSIKNHKLNLTSQNENFIGELDERKFQGMWRQSNKKNTPFILTPILKKQYLSAKCIKDPQKYAEQICQSINKRYNSNKGIEIKYLAHTYGDKKPIILTACQIQCGATGNCEYEIFLSENNCYRPVGNIGGATIEKLKTTHYGAPDLSAHWNGGCGGQEGMYYELHFDGSIYTIIGRRETKCPSH